MTLQISLTAARVILLTANYVADACFIFKCRRWIRIMPCTRLRLSFRKKFRANFLMIVKGEPREESIIVIFPNRSKKDIFSFMNDGLTRPEMEFFLPPYNLPSSRKKDTFFKKFSIHLKFTKMCRCTDPDPRGKISTKNCKINLYKLKNVNLNC